ncbi:MAG: hypothetical protein IPJ20_00050 [Flammeovirgaceae bacterium]|nr:hypothetical protein [Flammeovirgaceae bacterium]
MTKEIIAIEIEDEKQVLISGYHPNISFYFDLYKLLSLNDYTELNSFVFTKKDRLNHLTLQVVLFLVRNELLRKNTFFKLLEWSDSQVYDFELSSFQYNDNVLIKRYYHESGIELSASDLDSANHLFSLVKRTDWTVTSLKLKKLKELLNMKA